MPDALRLNKFLADVGLCSRREADRWIQAGRIAVNGQPAQDFSLRVTPGQDVVTLDGQPISALEAQQRRYVAFHKPVGCLTTRQDLRGRKTIYDVLPLECATLDPAGRLDQDSSGLLFLSNDGDWLNHMTHPRYHVSKRYTITIATPPKSPEVFTRALQAGIWFEPEQKLAQAFEVAWPERNPAELSLTLHTGYKRQIRRMFKALGHPVVTLRRVAIGSIALGDLPVGAIRDLGDEELDALQICRHSLP